MSVMNESTRRAFLAAVGASGVTAAVLPGAAGAAGADTGTGTGTGNPAVPSAGSTPLRTEAFPAATAGTNYLFAVGGAFQPLRQDYAFNVSDDQLQTGGTSGIFYYALTGLPTGARITEVSFAVRKATGTAGNTTFFVYRMSGDGVTASLDSRDTSALPVQPAEQYVNMVVDPTDPQWIVDNQQNANHWLVATLSANARVNSVRVGWVPGPTTPLSFFPISPKRAYDSRFVAPLGPLLNNVNRVISVANSYLTGTGTLETSNIIPVGAQAIAYNITIANTVTSGFLSVNPGDAATPGGSSINWFTSGLSLANGLVVKLDASRQIKVFCGGGGSTDFIIDILGYYA